MPCSVGKGFCMKAIPDICSSILRSNSGAGVGGRLKLGSVEMTWARAWGPQRPWAVGRCSCACLLTGESPTPAWSGGPPPLPRAPPTAACRQGLKPPGSGLRQPLLPRTATGAASLCTSLHSPLPTRGAPGAHPNPSTRELQDKDPGFTCVLALGKQLLCPGAPGGSSHPCPPGLAPCTHSAARSSSSPAPPPFCTRPPDCSLCSPFGAQRMGAVRQQVRELA